MKVWSLPQGSDRAELGLLEYKTLQDGKVFVAAAAGAAVAKAGGGRTRRSRRGRFIRARNLRTLTRALKAATHRLATKRVKTRLKADRQ